MFELFKWLLQNLGNTSPKIHLGLHLLQTKSLPFLKWQYFQGPPPCPGHPDCGLCLILSSNQYEWFGCKHLAVFGESSLSGLLASTGGLKWKGGSVSQPGVPTSSTSLSGPILGRRRRLRPLWGGGPHCSPGAMLPAIHVGWECGW